MNRNHACFRHATLRPRVLFRCVLSLCCGAASGFAAVAPADSPATNAAPVLTNVQQVAAFTTNLLFTSARAQFDAVVIYVSPPTRRLYVQQGQQALQLNLTAPVNRFRAGQEVHVEGDVVPSLPYPRVIRATARVIGDGVMPAPRPSSAARLAGGKDAFQFVTVRGIVRDMTAERGTLTLLLSAEGRAFEVVVPEAEPALPRDWIDAEIEVRGIGYPFFNARNFPTTFRLHASYRSDIRVVKPGAGAWFDRPAMTIAEASRQPWDWQRRLKITGTVTAHQPIDILFLDDGTGPMQANLLFQLAKPENGVTLEHDTPTWLQPGDRVEVIGARHNWSSLTPTLIHAEVRRIGKTHPIPPRNVSINDLKAGRFSGQVVCIGARILDQRLWATGNLQHQLLVLEAGDYVFQATWESEIPMTWDLQPGSYVRVTGVNDASQGQFNRACLFQLLLRSPSDVVVVPPPPFWERSDFRRLATAGGGVALFAGALIVLQRGQMRRLERRVSARTADLRNANESLREEVAARERAAVEVQRALAQEKQLGELKSRFVSMVSHEFRTPLAIIMSSAEILDAYLERLSREERATNLHDISEAARQMGAMMEEVLLLSRVEAGKMTFRPVAIDLASLCERIVDEIGSATNQRCPVQLTLPSGLPQARGDEALLRHVFTNLLVNAVKYSPPGTPVMFDVAVHGERAVFTVRDRGIGIPEADAKQIFTAFHRGRNVENVPGSGLGLVIVKSCVDLHQGTMTFESTEGHGTTFIVSLPLFQAPAGTSGGSARSRTATDVNPAIQAS